MHSRGTVSSRYACTRRLPACSPVHRDRTEGPSNFSTAVDRLQVYEVKAKYSCDRVSLAITSLKQARLGERISVRPIAQTCLSTPQGQRSKLKPVNQAASNSRPYLTASDVHAANTPQSCRNTIQQPAPHNPSHTDKRATPDRTHPLTPVPCPLVANPQPAPPGPIKIIHQTNT